MIGTSSKTGMLHRIALLAISAPRRILAVAALFMVAAGIFGVPVAKNLSASGFQDPHSESSKAATILTDKFGQGDVQLLFVVSTPDGVTGPAARAVGTEIVELLRHSTRVTSVTSAWTAAPAAATSLVSKDGRSGLIVAGVGGGETNAQRYADALSRQLAYDRNGVTVRSGGVRLHERFGISAGPTAAPSAREQSQISEAAMVPAGHVGYER
jgi:uncharacterized membrane protein YdfJ with MMPL/SSD domain